MVGRRADWSVFSRRLITPELDAGRSVNYRLTTHMISPARTSAERGAQHSPAEGQDFGKYRRELAPPRQRPHMLTGAMGPDLAKYRMHIFKPGLKPGHPTPLSWRRRDIYSSDDATAKSEDEALYRTTHLRGV